MSLLVNIDTKPLDEYLKECGSDYEVSIERTGIDGLSSAVTLLGSLGTKVQLDFIDLIFNQMTNAQENVSNAPRNYLMEILLCEVTLDCKWPKGEVCNVEGYELTNNIDGVITLWIDKPKTIFHVAQDWELTAEEVISMMESFTVNGSGRRFNAKGYNLAQLNSTIEDWLKDITLHAKRSLEDGK